MYQKLYNSCNKSNSDIAVCNRKVFDESGNEKTIVNVSSQEIHVDNENLIDYIVDKLFYPHTVVVYNKIFKRSILSTNNIKFKEVNQVGSEDALFNYQVLFHISKIIEVSSTNHNQLAREGSTARSYKIGAMTRTSGLIEEIYKYFSENGNDEISSILAPINLLFFQQWNYNLIKTYGENNLKKNLFEEHILIRDNLYFKRAEKEFILKKGLTRYVKKMGYSDKGILFMKLYMFFDLLNMSKLAVQIRCWC